MNTVRYTLPVTVGRGIGLIQAMKEDRLTRWCNRLAKPQAAFIAR